MSAFGDRPRGSVTSVVLRVLCRMLRLAAAAAAGAAVAITLLSAMTSDAKELPGTSVVISLLVLAVVAFLTSMLLVVVADRLAGRAERKAGQRHQFTPEEREAERLCETPLLARKQNRPRRTSLDL